MELNFNNSVSGRTLDQTAQQNHLVATNPNTLYLDWAKWSNKMDQIQEHVNLLEEKDSTILNTFKSVTLDYLRERIGSRKFLYSFTITLDLRKRALSSLRNDFLSQWSHIKRTMRCFMCTYNYIYYMVPELTKRGIIHAHGIILFRAKDFDQMSYDRSRWVRKLKLKCGNCMQWTRVNNLYNSYVPTESNVLVRRPQKLSNWIDYIHKGNLKHYIGHSNMMS